LIESCRELVNYAAELGVTQFEPRIAARSADDDSSDEDLPRNSMPSSLLRNAEAAERVSRDTRARIDHATEHDPATVKAPPAVPGRTDSREQRISVAPIGSLFGPNTSDAPLDLPEKARAIDLIRNEIGDCTRCVLCEGRTNVVHSEGSLRARLMIVGEAPGADEDIQSRPFVGRAGQLLTKIIEAINLKREEVFIGNVNRCRPPQNRAPTIEEAATCRPFILREIAVVQPEVIVVMGNTAMKNLLDKKVDTKLGITRLRGIFHDFDGIKVMPTFHPAYLLRDPSKKREVWDDMKKVRDYLDKTQVHDS
jgi:DNA polymerase